MREGRGGRSADPSESTGRKRLDSAAPCAFQSSGLPEVSFCVSAGPLGPSTMSIQHRALLLEGDKPVSGTWGTSAHPQGLSSAPSSSHLPSMHRNFLLRYKILSG